MGIIARRNPHLKELNHNNFPKLLYFIIFGSH